MQKRGENLMYLFESNRSAFFINLILKTKKLCNNIIHKLFTKKKKRNLPVKLKFHNLMLLRKLRLEIFFM